MEEPSVTPAACCCSIPHSCKTPPPAERAAPDLRAGIIIIARGAPGGAGGLAADGDGGALCSLSDNAVVVNSTFVSNSAFGGQGGPGGGGGDPLYERGAQGGAGGNGANGANGVGGGICLLGGAMSLTNVTCAANQSTAGAAGSGGGGANEGYPTVAGPARRERPAGNRFGRNHRQRGRLLHCQKYDSRLRPRRDQRLRPDD